VKELTQAKEKAVEMKSGKGGEDFEEEIRVLKVGVREQSE